LVQTVIHTPANPANEGSPIDLFAAAFGMSLGVPIYAVASYAFLRRWKHLPILAGRTVHDS
jgi:hypothetical protein